MYSLSKYLVLTCLCLLVLTWTYRQADACTPLPPEVKWSYPAEDATDIPTNAAIFIGMNNGSGGFNATLKNDKGEEIKITSEAVGSVTIYTPESVLAANTKYTFECDSCYQNEQNKKGYSFTTGDKEDTTADTYTGATEVTYVTKAAVTTPAGPCDSVHPELYIFTI